MIYDVAVIGGGPAGLTAALYLRRANKSVVVIEKNNFGGQITFSPKVENIPGFVSVTGNEFAEKSVEQCIAQGADFEMCEVLSIVDGETKIIKTDGGDFESRAVIIATGAKHRMLGVPNEDSYVGNGISFCAVCDGAFYNGKNVGVVGGGNSALQEAILLSDNAKHIDVFQNLDFLTGENKLCEQLLSKPNVTVHYGVVVDGLDGEGELKGVTVKDKNDNKTHFELDGLFIAIGLIPQNEPFAGHIELDKAGYAIGNEDMSAKSKGFFVAGDCRQKRIRQVATAASDGAIAALSACDYIDNKNQ